MAAPELAATPTPCRFCARPLAHVVADLGMSPLANAYLHPDQVSAMEPFYPLRALVCEECFLVQLEEFESPQAIFGEYAYFSSYSTTWLEHAREYVEMALERLSLNAESRVVEVASNDGYLLQYFHEREIPVLGVEPAANVARVALQKGIPTLVEFFGVQAARDLAEQWKADLLIGNNVLAHVPDLNDFVGGLKVLLAPGGVVTMEFPHLERMVAENEFDTIYHEHFSYFSWLTAERVFSHHGLTLFDVEELPTHGGSLRIWGRHADDGSKPVTERAQALGERERAAGFESLEPYSRFAAGVQEAKRELLDFLIDLKRQGKRIVGYGAPAKGNTLLNYCGIGTDFLDFTVDISPHKQGSYLPGSHIPIHAPEAIREARPDVLFILPWNLRDEIVAQHDYIREWGGQFAVRVPRLELV
jgi:SAM-dependent methyltransferase